MRYSYKYVLFTVIAWFLALSLHAQVITVIYQVNTSSERHVISPYIYGYNNGSYAYATWHRFGGNRTSAYNWENNFSNAGVDYINNNDDYLPSVMGLASADYKKPAACLIAFHDTSIAHSILSAITLPMVGYVSNDGDGVVSASELAPSARWNKVYDVKGAVLSLVPDTTDHKVYVDEELNFLVNKFGMANSSTGIKAYILDNEPGLWCTQFPHMRSNCVTYNELFTKTIATAEAIKQIDSTANVFGPESWGFSEYWNLQFASDASSHSADHWFIDSYLKEMKQAEDTSGKKLLNVFTVHWYPQVNNVTSDDISLLTAEARMQCPRSLWDSGYVENSWITTSGFAAELPIIPHIQHSISTFYPGTKFGIDEYDYGAHGHISGGIAQADVLGIFGSTGLDYAAIWGTIDGFVKSAFNIYRNYNGAGGRFGAIHSMAKSNDTNSTIYASVVDTSDNILHAIVTNKYYNDTITALIAINSKVSYNNIDLYYFNSADSNIFHQHIPSSSIREDTFRYAIPPLTVAHFVFKDTIALAVNTINQTQSLQMIIWPNPAKDKAIIHYELSDGRIGTLTICDVSGRVLKTYGNLMGIGNIDVNVLNAGIYFAHCTDGVESKTEKLIISN
ncbi:MAG TPA: glycoside hydrolase family 44 protein [Flavipsychrobacter sp.]|nr:glycoside hydrolase family 44 protein [Flavipsychrobacter sp.]